MYKYTHTIYLLNKVQLDDSINSATQFGSTIQFDSTIQFSSTNQFNLPRGPRVRAGVRCTLFWLARDELDRRIELNRRL